METNSLDDRVAKEIEDTSEYAGELEQIATPIQLPKETLEFFNADELRARVFYEKYALKDMDGNVVEQTPVDMWTRVARELASVETTEDKRSEWAKKFYWLLENFRFVPGGRIMFGAGQPRRSTLLNCYYPSDKVRFPREHIRILQGSRQDLFVRRRSGHRHFHP